MAQQPVFIYGFVHSNSPDDMGPIGIEKAHVRVVPDGEIAAVVSDSPYGDFGSLEKETLLRSLAVYQSVIEKIMERFKIVPMKYGTVVESQELLKRVMVQNHGRIDQSLSETEGKIELDVVAFWNDFDAVLQDLGQHQDIKQVREEAETGAGGSLQEIRIKVGKMVKEALDRKKKKIADQVLSTLKHRAKQHCLHSLMDDAMIMNAAFLMDEEEEPSFEETVKGLDHYFQDTVNFRIVGPLPAYSFLTLMLKKVDPQEIEAARKLLGLGMSATAEELRDAFWKVSKTSHPDRFPGDDAVRKRYETIAKAYRLLDEYCEGKWCSFETSDLAARIEMAPTGNSGGR